MSAATQCAVLPAASSAAPAARAPRTAARSGLPARDAPPAAAPAVLYAPPRRLRLVASGAPPAVPHEVRVAERPRFLPTQGYGHAPQLVRRAPCSATPLRREGLLARVMRHTAAAH